MRFPKTVLTLTLGLASLSCSKSDPAGAQLVVDKMVTSVIVGATDDIIVTAATADGATDSFSVSYDSQNISATTSGTTITVHGVTLGRATLTITSGAGVVATVQVNVHDPVLFDAGGLLLTFVDDFQFIWGDGGSGGDNDGSYWRPVPPAGFFALGSYGRGGYDDPSGVAAVVAVREINGSGALAAPTEYTQVWNDSGSGADLDVSFWRPVPPSAAYVCLGLVAILGHGPAPSTDEVRCIRKDLTAPGSVGPWIWDDTGTGADADFGSWEVDPPNTANLGGMAYVKTGAFLGAASHAAPSGDSLANVLNVAIPVVLDYNDVTFAPTLTSAEEPEANTAPFLAKIIAVPFTFVTDNLQSSAWKVANSPIYRVEREAFYRLLAFEDNRNSTTDAEVTVTDTVGVTHEKSESYSVTTGISITVEAGIELEGVSAKTSVTVSQEFGYSSSTSLAEFSERSVSKTLTVAPGKVGALWQRSNRFTLKRKVGDSWQPVADPWEITTNSFVKAEYPL